MSSAPWSDRLQPFSLQLPSSIQFGRGTANSAIAWIEQHCRNVLIIHGASSRRSAWLMEQLAKQRDIDFCQFACPREPDVPLVEAAVALGRDAGVDAIVGIGGGAVIDLAKAVAGFIPAAGKTLDYLEVVGKGEALDAEPLPWLAIPTTAGTGAEVTANAVIGVPEAERKVSLRDPRLLANLAIVDPALTDNSPTHVTLASGLDAITQVIEPYISSQANAFTDALCRDAIPRGLAAIQVLMRQESTAARDQMAWTSLCGGLALANAKLGAVHGLAGPLGGVSTAAHGAIAGVLLPWALAVNAAATTGETAQRIDEIRQWISAAFDVPQHSAFDDLARWSSEQGLPALRDMGVGRNQLPAIAQAAQGSSSMRGNPVALSVEQLLEIMHKAW